MANINVLIGTANTLITSIATVSLSFLLLMLLLKKYAWGPVTKMMDKRAEMIANDLDSAEKARIDAQELADANTALLQESRIEATNIIRKAKESAEKEADKIVTDAHIETKRYVEQAKHELELERTKMVEAARREVADLSIQIAEKIIKKELDVTTHKALIDSYIEELGNHES